MSTPYTSRAASKQRIIASEFEAIAVVWFEEGSKQKPIELPISRFSMSFEAGMDSLPSARIEAALGLNMRNGSFAEVPSNLNELTEISVYFRASGQSRAGVVWPDNYHLIWHGRVSGLNVSLSVGSFTIAIDSTHWTKALDYGTCAVSGFVKSSAIDYFAVAGGSVSGATFANSVGILEGIAKAAVTTGNYANPAIWDKVIVPMLGALTAPPDALATVRSTNGLLQTITTLNNFGCGVTPAAQEIIAKGLTGNLEALSILARKQVVTENDAKAVIAQGPSTNKLTKFSPKPKSQLSIVKPTGFYFNNDNETVVPSLNFQIAATPQTTTTSNRNIDSEATFLSVVRGIGGAFGRELGSHSVLDKIVWASNQFHFKLLPNARTVCVAPAIPLFPKSRVWRTLSANDCLAINAPASFPTKLAGVVFVGQDPKNSSRSGYGSNGQVYYPMGAFFGSNTGRVEVINTPDYLQIQPVEPQVQASGSKVNPIYAKTKNIWQPNMQVTSSLLGCRVAQSQWCASTFGGYMLEVRCPLRFDIGPGSYIKVEDFRSASAIGQNDLGNVYGYVQSVTVTLDANSGTSSTSLQLTHVRPDDDAVEALLPNSHPMYDSASTWSGHELVRMVQDRTGIRSP